MLRYRLSRLFAKPKQDVNNDVIRKECDEIHEYEGIGVVLKVQDPNISSMYSIDRVMICVMMWCIESTAVGMTAHRGQNRAKKKGGSKTKQDGTRCNRKRHDRE
jgi:hypothetical protein